MKKPLLIILLLAAFAFANAQSAWQWARQANYYHPKYSDEAEGLAIDPSGNLFTVGYFQDSVIIFGADTLVNTNGFEEGYLAKYDANGNAIWAKKIGGPDSDFALDVATDKNGNIIVTGSFKSSQLVLGADTLLNAGAEDMFIVKFDASGNILWAKGGGGTSSDYGECVSTDSVGNIYLSGHMGSSYCNFGQIGLNLVGTHSLFILKYDPNGTIIWGQNPLTDGAPYSDTKKHHTDKAGNLYVSSQPVSGPSSIVLEKFSNAGGLLWIKNMVGANGNISVRSDDFGNVYVISYFYGDSIMLDTVTLYNSSTNINPHGDMYIVKYDAGGNLRWVRRSIGSDYEWGTAVSIDNQGTVYAAGVFTSAVVHFDGISITKADSSSENIFLAVYDSSGNIQTAVNTVNLGGYNIPYNIWNDAMGNTYLAGSYVADTIYFGTQVLINPVGHNLGTNHGYLAKWAQNMTTAITPGAVAQKNKVVVYPNPGRGFFKIRSQCVIRKVEVTDLAGKVLFTEKANSLNVEIDLTSYTRGIYYCKVTAEEGVPATVKVIVE